MTLEELTKTRKEDKKKLVAEMLRLVKEFEKKHGVVLASVIPCHVRGIGVPEETVLIEVVFRD